VSFSALTLLVGHQEQEEHPACKKFRLSWKRGWKGIWPVKKGMVEVGTG